MGEENNIVMPVQPMNNGGYGGNGFFGGFDGFWGILLVILLLGGGMWGGFGGMNGANNGSMIYPWMNQAAITQDGFNQAATTSLLGDINTGMTAGFAGVNMSVNNAQNALSQQLYTNQIADMNQNFAMQSAFQNCCCENRLATCQTQNVITSDGAATRSAIQNGVQAVLDKMCQDKIDTKNETIVALNNRINALEANNYVQNALTAQTQYFLSLYPPTAAAARTTTSGT